MPSNRFNWQIVVGFLLSLFAFASGPMIFSQRSISTDSRWLSIALFVVAAIFMTVGLRRAFAAGRGTLSKIAAAILTLACSLIFGLFLYFAFFLATSLPKSAGAPQVGQKAPDFRLADAGGAQVSLTETLTKQKGVLLVFYRGYW
jgi:hypothetical protein